MLQRYYHLFRLVRMARAPRVLMVVALVLAVLETAAALWTPLLTRDLIDGQFLMGPAVLLASVLTGQALLGGIGYYLLGRGGHQMVANLRRFLFAHILRLPVPFHDEHESGELVSRVTGDTETISDLVTNQLVGLLTGVIMITASLIVLWYLDWRMTLTLFGTVFGAVIIIVPIALSLYGIAKGLQDEMAHFTARLSGVLGQIRLVKASRAEDFETKRVNGSIGRLLDLNLRETRINSILSPVVEIAMTAAMIVILGYGGSRVGSGELEIGVLVAFILYMFNITIPMVRFSTFFGELQRASGAGERMAELLGLAGEAQSGRQSLESEAGSLQFENVGFAYSESRGPVLGDVSFELVPGKTTALVGPSGSGKSTLLSLIQRFYKPSSGTIKMDGMPIESYSLESWRSLLGYVAQDSPAISGTIRDNICYGLDQVSDDDLDHAAEAALLTEFIASLPQGYDTPLGERGVKLSGGQRQRIAIARAILADPAILILDEATSSLDVESEHLISRALHNLTRGRTTLVSSHRFSTIAGADRVLVLEDGRLTGIGQHQELLEKHPFYSTLVAKQTALPESA